MAKKEHEIKNSKNLGKKVDKDLKESKGKKTSSKGSDKKSKDVKNTKTEKSSKDMSPLEKARLARAKGGGGKAKSKKKVLPLFKAPEDFKPHFVTVMMKIEKDGLLAGGIKMTRFVGRYDPEADDKKKFDVMAYDPKTVLGVLSRFAGVTFITNADKRVPKGVYQVLLRVNKKSADGSLSVLFKGMQQAVQSKKTGRTKLQDMDKTDPVYRRFRKAARLLPAAFQTVLMPPKRTRGANKKEVDDE
jgi:hypothetical protein